MKTYMPDGQTAKPQPIWTARSDVFWSGYRAGEKINKYKFYSRTYPAKSSDVDSENNLTMWWIHQEKIWCIGLQGTSCNTYPPCHHFSIS